MSPLIRALYKSLRLCYTVHITHLGMAVKLHALLWASVHSGASEIRYLFDSGNRTDCQLTVKTINRGNTFDFQESSLFNMFLDLRYLLITQKHLNCNGVCEISNRKDQDRFFVSDFPGFQIHYLTAYYNLAHLLYNILQRNRFVLEISSIYNIRIRILSVSTAEIAPFAFLFHWLFLKGLLLFSWFCLFRLCCRSCLAGSTLFLLFLICQRSCCLFSFCGKPGMLQHICHFLSDLNGSILTVSALLCLYIVQRNLQIHSTPLTEHLVKILHKDLTLLPGDHRIRKHHIQAVLLRKCDLSLFKQIVFQHIVITKLQLHT